MPNRSHFTKSPAYRDWANFQDEELQERKGDGYSAWEYMKDSLPALYHNARSKMAEQYNNDSYMSNGEPHYPTDKMRSMLEQMRDIADKDQKEPKRAHSAQERAAMSAWTLMMLNGSLDY